MTREVAEAGRPRVCEMMRSHFALPGGPWASAGTESRVRLQREFALSNDGASADVCLVPFAAAGARFSAVFALPAQSMLGPEYVPDDHVARAERLLIA